MAPGMAGDRPLHTLEILRTHLFLKPFELAFQPAVGGDVGCLTGSGLRMTIS
jgi:hypothetical protein